MRTELADEARPAARAAEDDEPLPEQHDPLDAAARLELLGLHHGNPVPADQGAHGRARSRLRQELVVVVAQHRVLPLVSVSRQWREPSTGPRLDYAAPATECWHLAARAASGRQAVARARTSAACFSTTVPLKKSGFTSPQKRTALANMKSRKSSSVSSPCSTSS